MLLKINITVDKPGIGLQLIDMVYAYRQSLDVGHKSDWHISFGPHDTNCDLNILFSQMPGKNHLESKFDLSCFDYILFCNGGEPLQVASQGIEDLLKRENAFLISNSMLPYNHPLYSKIITHLDAILIGQQYWTQPFYHHFFAANSKKSLTRLPTIWAINGQARTWRYMFFEELKKANLGIEIRDAISTVVNTHIANWESLEDTEFRQSLEIEYNNILIENPVESTYYVDLPLNGIDGKFGDIPPGNEFLDEYFTNSCVVFPETSWQNNELCLTEKALKCFYAGSLPFPIGGANINKLYNEIGYNTAWNLLPNELKLFDSELNHRERYTMIVAAITWLSTNTNIFLSNTFKQLTADNKDNFLTCKSLHKCVIIANKKFENMFNRGEENGINKT